MEAVFERLAHNYPLWFVAIFVFMLGAVFGSFLNVCILRFPKFDSNNLWAQLTGIWGRSSCPRCKTEILAKDNIPILGWLMLGGKCRSCKLGISFQYPLIELANGLLWVLVFLLEFPNGFATEWAEQCCANNMGPQGISVLAPNVWMFVRFLFHMVLIEALLVATIIDIRLQIIPDGCTIPPLIVGVLASTVFGQMFLVPLWWDPDPIQQTLLDDLLPASIASLRFDGIGFAVTNPHWHGFFASIAGAVVGAGMTWVVRIIGHAVLRREAMGFGDVILMATIGSFIGWQPVTIVFFLAAMCAMVAVLISLPFGWSQEIPYGPYLSLGAVLVILFFEPIWKYSEQFFSYGVGIFFFGGGMCIALIGSLFLLQLVKRMLGFNLYEERLDEWTSADGLHYYAGEKVDEQTGQWKRSGWDGTLSSRGQLQEKIWRDGGDRR